MTEFDGTNNNYYFPSSVSLSDNNFTEPVIPLTPGNNYTITLFFTVKKIIAFKMYFGVRLDATGFKNLMTRYKDGTGYHWLTYVVDEFHACFPDTCLNEYDTYAGVIVGTNKTTNPSANLPFMASEIQFSFGLYQWNYYDYMNYISEIVIFSETTTFPTMSPTKIPTEIPTMAPTDSPTSYIWHGKITLNYKYYFFHSNNVYDLLQRNNMTYNTPYRLPDNSTKYCVTCLLAWSDIDASIDVPGCRNQNGQFNMAGEKSDFYNCEALYPNGWFTHFFFMFCFCVQKIRTRIQKTQKKY